MGPHVSHPWNPYPRGEFNRTTDWREHPLFPGVEPYYTLDAACQTVYLPGWEFYNIGYRDRIRYLHGWTAVFAWSFLGSIMIVTNRYLSGILWNYFFWIHAICGVLLYIINFGSSYYVWHSTFFGVAT